MIEKREKLCYGVDGLREMKAEADLRGSSRIFGPGNAAIALAASAAGSIPVTSNTICAQLGAYVKRNYGIEPENLPFSKEDNAI